MRPELGHATLRNDGDLVGVAYRGEAVRHDEGSTALLRLQVVKGRLNLNLFFIPGATGKGREAYHVCNHGHHQPA